MDGLIILLWCVFGLMGYYIFKNKGRSEGLGCLLGFLLGPLALIVMVLVPANDTVLRDREQEQQRLHEQQEINRGTMKRCPACAEVIRSQAQVCHHCGFEYGSLTSTSKRKNDEF